MSLQTSRREVTRNNCFFRSFIGKFTDIITYFNVGIHLSKGKLSGHPESGRQYGFLKKQCGEKSCLIFIDFQAYSEAIFTSTQHLYSLWLISEMATSTSYIWSICVVLSFLYVFTAGMFQITFNFVTVVFIHRAFNLLIFIIWFLAFRCSGATRWCCCGR